MTKTKELSENIYDLKLKVMGQGELGTFWEIRYILKKSLKDHLMLDVQNLVQP